MAQQSIDVKLNLLAQQAAKDLAGINKQLDEVEKSEGQAESAGQIMARAISAAADEIEADFKASKSAADALAQALGPEMAAKVGQNGIDKMVGDLKNAGLTTDQIKADVGELAGAIQHLDDVGKSMTVGDDLKNVGDASDTAKGKLGEMHGEADQSRSVLANMVGNSVQDLGALGGVAGSAGVAIGQLAEYAADGNIALSGLVAFAGPLIAIGVVTALISNHMKEIAAHKAFDKHRVEEFTKALKDGATAAQAWDKAFDPETGKLEFFDAATGKVNNAAHALAAHGVTWDEFKSHLNGGQAAFEAWAGSAESGIPAGDDLNAVIQTGTQLIKEHTTALQGNTDAYILTGQAASETDRENRRLNTGLVDGSADFAKAQHAAENSAKGVHTFETAAADADEAYRRLTGKLSEEDAWATVNESIKNFNENTKHTSADVRTVSQDIADYVIQTDSIPASKKTEILALLDQGQILQAEAALAELTRDREIRISIINAGSQDIIDRLTLKGAKAEGGPVVAGEAYTVGEKGTETFVPDTNGTILPHGFGGNTTIINHWPPGVSAQAYAKAQREYQRRGGQ